MGTTLGSECVLYTADTQPTMLHKLKCHFRRISEGFEKKHSLQNKPNGLAKPKRIELRTKILSPMPRCSTYKLLTSIETTSTSQKEIKSKNFARTKDNNDSDDYEQWKIDFEAARPQITHSERTNAFKLPEVLAGQITPNGYPAYTNVAKAIAATITIEAATIPGAQPAHSNKWRTMSLRSNRQNDAKNALAANSLSLNSTFTVHRRLSLRLPVIFNSSSNTSQDEKQDKSKDGEKSSRKSKISPSNSRLSEMEMTQQQQSPIFLSKMCKEHANVIEKIHQEIKDLEDYYGTRLDYYYL